MLKYSSSSTPTPLLKNINLGKAEGMNQQIRVLQNQVAALEEKNQNITRKHAVATETRWIAASLATLLPRNDKHKAQYHPCHRDLSSPLSSRVLKARGDPLVLNKRIAPCVCVPPRHDG